MSEAENTDYDYSAYEEAKPAPASNSLAHLTALAEEQAQCEAVVAACQAALMLLDPSGR